MSVSMDDIQKSFTTICEMLQDRLEENDNAEEQAIVNALREMSGDVLAKTAENNATFSIVIEKKLRILYYLQRFKTTDMLSAIAKDKNQYEHYIVVLKEKSNSSSTKSIMDKLGNNAEVEIFDIKELIFNITKHSLVPKHILVKNENTIRQLFADLQIENRIQLPLILRTDAMARYLNAKPGNLVKIIRYPITSAEHLVYRTVV
jgi:DNA-directed RNA polymerase subunit H (RpoH/RPB5)